MALSVIILAAGQGTRMKSQLPKVLHRIAGVPMLEHVHRAAAQFPDTEVHVVYGHGGERVRESLPHLRAQWVKQAEQLGTGHAVMQAMPNVRAGDTALILYGDVPLITHETLRRLVDAAANGSFGLLTVVLDNPTGYGRIVRDAAGKVRRIVEQKDASDAEKRINEINTGMMAVDADRLKRWVGQLSNSNAQKEYYLTDVIEMAVRDDVAINAVSPASPFEVMGVNDRVQLAELERHYQSLQAERLMRAGVTLLDPARFDVRGDVETGQDVSIDVNVVLEGSVRLGNRVRIGANTVLRNVTVGDDTIILENCVIEDATIGRSARIGPFSRVRPESVLGDDAHIGNFVEVKKSVVGTGSKVNHLSYIGDTDIGEKCNIGAGTITCNYDGANKFRTVIGNDVFVGSDCQLVAPVRVEDGATLGAGTTLTKDAPAGKLTISRPRQQTIENWQRPVKKK